MQSLASNTQLIYYALFEGVADKVDEQGYKSGSKEKRYSDPQPFRIYVSPSRGVAEVEQFGINENYTNLMSTCDLSCPIKEDTILWVGVNPFKNGVDGETVPHTHSVQRRAEGKNSLLFAIQDVTVT